MKKIKKEIYVWLASIEWIYLGFISNFPSRTIRLILLKRLGAKICDNVSIFGGVKFRNPAKLIINEGCSIGPGVLLDSRCGLEIGKNVTIASETIIWTLHHDYNDSNFKTIGEKVVIGNYAWLCSRSIILPGVTIGEYAVIASGSVVTKNVEPYTVVGGVPAKKIGEREKKEYLYSPYYNLHII